MGHNSFSAACLVFAEVIAVLSGSELSAHPADHHLQGTRTGTLQELLRNFLPSPAYAEEFSGPTKPKGITSKALGKASLTDELPGLENKNLRARFWTMEPGGIVPVHSHVDRPAFVYVVQGEVTEHRSDSEEPHVYQAGDLSTEDGGVVHWWENTGDIEVHLIAFDMFTSN
ncbi:cupin domain-containing protein [Ruegeria sp. SCPT10]|uniref:cupin domain-containing protein n=1 Tax=Ruegeria sp. SCP10 TaxID=3141377 RepID=UPI003334B35F